MLAAEPARALRDGDAIRLPFGSRLKPGRNWLASFLRLLNR
jgi:hypothetical protein